MLTEFNLLKDSPKIIDEKKMFEEITELSEKIKFFNLNDPKNKNLLGNYERHLLRIVKNINEFTKDKFKFNNKDKKAQLAELVVGLLKNQNESALPFLKNKNCALLIGENKQKFN